MCYSDLNEQSENTVFKGLKLCMHPNPKLQNYCTCKWTYKSFMCISTYLPQSLPYVMYAGLMCFTTHELAELHTTVMHSIASFCKK